MTTRRPPGEVLNERGPLFGGEVQGSGNPTKREDRERERRGGRGRTPRNQEPRGGGARAKPKPHTHTRSESAQLAAGTRGTRAPLCVCLVSLVSWCCLLSAVCCCVWCCCWVCGRDLADRRPQTQTQTQTQDTDTRKGTKRAPCRRAPPRARTLYSLCGTWKCAGVTSPSNQGTQAAVCWNGGTSKRE